MVRVEVNMVVPDSLETLALYESIFEVERLEVTNFEKGMNEAIFSMYGTRFHMLDENPEYMLIAPKGGIQPMWMNVLVPDIKATYAKAMAAGCVEIQPVKELPAMGVSNAIFQDPFGFQWLLHQVHRVISFEERLRIMEDCVRKGQL